jgi:hypothetical protein
MVHRDKTLQIFLLIGTVLSFTQQRIMVTSIVVFV